MSHVVIVGADKGGVGKTTVSGTLLEYLKMKAIEVRAFDTEVPNGILVRFHRDITELVDLTTSDGQMKVFDALARAPVTLIDVRAGLLSPALETLRKIGLLEAVQAGRMRLTMMHVIGASVASFEEIATTAEVLAGAKHYLVKNHINNASFFGWDEAVRKALEIGDGVIEIPKLDELAMEHIQTMGISGTAFVQNEQNSWVLRGYTRDWLKQIYAQYDQKLTF